MNDKIVNTGFFTMDDVKTLEQIGDLEKAKQFATERVEAMPLAKKENVRKIQSAIAKARNLTQLMFTMANFVLAHPSEHLKVIR